MDARKMFRSFKYAFQGIGHLIKHENNARFHFLAAVLVIISGIYFRIERMEWIAVILSIFFVFSAEAFNTAIEKLCDKFHPEQSNVIGKIKDLAAAAVLFAAISSLTIALIIFVPHFCSLLSF
jgi:diacylglycerol kinase (ATP)